MVSKLPWLEEALERGIEVLIYNGNLVKNIFSVLQKFKTLNDK
jgi:hypothetical protein